MKNKLGLLGALMLTGCTHFNNHFDCPFPHEGHCQRLSAINEAYNQKGAWKEMSENVAFVYLFPNPQPTPHKIIKAK